MRRLVQWLACGAMACWPVAAHAEWQEARTAHFVVYSDDKPAAVSHFAERLERFDRLLRFLTSAPTTTSGPANPVTVYVVDDQSAVASLAGSANVAGFYIPRAGGSVAFVPRQMVQESANAIGAEAILFHEYTHHFMLSNWADAAFPAWFVEGFAEFFGPTRMKPDGSIEIGRPAMYRADAFADGLPVSSATLLSGNASKSGVDGIYAQGWLLTHMLVFDSSRKGQLGSYMDAINAGKPMMEAARALGEPRQLDRDLSAYMRRGMRYSTLPSGMIPELPVTVRALRPAEVAMMRTQQRSKKGVTPEQARQLVPGARRAAGPYPNDPAAQVALAEAEYDAGNYAEAEAAARRTIAADPRSVDGHLYLGMARAAAAQAGKVTDPAQWRDIRKSFLAANAIDNDAAEPLVEFYKSYGVAGTPLTANTRAALMRAHLLGPQDPDVRMLVAADLLDQGKTADARKMLGPIAYAPHRDDNATLAASMIATIDQDGGPAALAKWREATKGAKKDAKGANAA